jgi:predicted AAA+ superfamily ATPase
LLEAFRDYLENTIADAHIIHANFNLTEFENLLEYHALNNYIKSRFDPGKQNFILIDEIQMCDGFEKAVNSFHASEKYDIYITGSNAFLLSSDLATLFTGRTFEIEVYPFSFAEFVRYYEQSDIDAAFDRYLFEGGMSGSYVYKNPDGRNRYIADVFDTLVLRDIRRKYKIRKADLLERLANFMMDNISNITSARSIANTFVSGKYEISDQTAGAYIRYLTSAFAFYKVRRFDIRGRKYLTSGDKYYLCDHSFKYAKLGTRNLDYGRTYENIVAMELMRRGYEAYAGVLYKKEIDFVAIRQSEKIYIQVCDDISSDTTLDRESRPLLMIRDAYPKMILARTRHDAYTYEGIVIQNIAQWLLDGRNTKSGVTEM